MVIAEMLGVDPARRADFKRWSDALVLGFLPFPTDEQMAQMDDARRNLDEVFANEIAERRASPRDDLIGRMVAAEEAGDQLTDEEIVTMCGLLLAAGNVTTTDLIGNGVYALLTNPEQLRALRERPELIEHAVEEMLRFDSPVTNTGRIAMKDMEIDGCPVEKGDNFMVSLAGANHDPALYPDPDSFDLSRGGSEPPLLRRRHARLPGRAPCAHGSTGGHPGADRPLPTPGAGGGEPATARDPGLPRPRSPVDAPAGEAASPRPGSPPPATENFARRGDDGNWAAAHTRGDAAGGVALRRSASGAQPRRRAGRRCRSAATMSWATSWWGRTR
ncbi:MAG: cytochrome P450 [Dehalococcoidia bacterium]|nr:cytochrome P450 [Dehalococcoidia bacterium]